MTLSDTGGADLELAVVEVIAGHPGQARFVRQVAAVLTDRGVPAAAIECAVHNLQRRGVVLVRDNFCADPHLANVDLRVIGLLESRTPEVAAAAVERVWNSWLADYLATHRCG